jgi:hypothetical protein
MLEPVNRCQLSDRRIQAVAAGGDGQHGVEGLVEGDLHGGLSETVTAQPLLMCRGPRGPAVVDDSVSQQKFRAPMPGTHQVGAGVLPRPHQIPGGLLGLTWHPHRWQLPDMQQPRQAGRVTLVGLDPITRRTFQLRRSDHHTTYVRRQPILNLDLRRSLDLAVDERSSGYLDQWR